MSLLEMRKMGEARCLCVCELVFVYSLKLEHISLYSRLLISQFIQALRISRYITLVLKKLIYSKRHYSQWPKGGNNSNE